MSRQVRGGYTAALFLFIVFLPTETVLGQSKNAVESIDRYLTERTELGRFSGAVLIARDGKILLRKGYGYADVERKIPFTPQTQQSFASVTKMFTCAAVLKLRDQGKLKLDDSVCAHLDDCPESWKPVTIQHLMRHVSGIPDYEEALDLGSDKYLEFMTRPDATARIVETAKKQPLDFKPGEKFRYSNTGYVVLGHIVQKASGTPFAEFVRKHVLKPAGMTDSGFFGWGKAPKNLAVGHTHGDLGWEKTMAGFSLLSRDLKQLPRLALTPPAGDAGLYGTVDDLYRWSLAMDGGKVISSAEAAEILTPGTNGYGYGWFIGKGFDRKRARHNGILPGHVTDFIKFPDDHVTIILVSNLDRVRLSAVARDVTAGVLGESFDPPVRGQVVKLADEQIARLVGEYKTAEGETLVVRKDPDLLVAEIKGRFQAGLIPLSATEFYVPLTDGKAVFTPDETGKAKKVNLRHGGKDHIAERIETKP